MTATSTGERRQGARPYTFPMLRSNFLTLLALACIVCFAESLSGGQPQALIEGVSLSRPFFNPTLNQKVRVNFSIRSNGSLDATVLDRDGYPVRSLASGKPVQMGLQTLEWDGRDDAGVPVPDEAYSFKIDLSSSGTVSTYFPASATPEELEVQANYYDRRRATLSYNLPKAARVHIQAGTATVDPRTKKTTGPVLKTLVNREPRPKGAVVDYWSGYDESGTIHVPSLPHFVVGIAGTTLPENAVITTGNRSVKFVDTISERKGHSSLPSTNPSHHHQGLTTLDDISPPLSLTPKNASWSKADQVWVLDGRDFQVTGKLEGPAAQSFRRQPGRLLLFVDEHVVSSLHPTTGFDLDLPFKALSPGNHVVAVNWVSDFGPTAANSMRVRVPEKQASLH